MARALRLNPVAIRRAIYADGWLGGYRRAVRRAMDAQVRRVAARAAAGEQVVIDDAEIERWAAEIDRAKRDRVHAMVRDGFALAGREFRAPAKALGRSPGPDTPMSIAVGEGEEFLIRADFKDVDEWVETTSLSESRTSAKKLEAIFTKASRTVKKDAEGRVRGTTPKEIAREILRKGLADDRARASMLARTGTIWAFNEGAQQRYKAEGVTVEEWMVTADDVTCPYCQRMDGRRVRVDESFMSAGESMTVEGPAGKPLTLGVSLDVQHPPLHPNCRCTMVPVLPELPREVVVPTAVEPAIPPTPDRPLDTRAAARKWQRSLPPEEVNAVLSWVGYSTDLRKIQAGVVKGSKKLQAENRAFISAMQKSPRNAQSVWRGLSDVSPKAFKQMQTAQTIQLDAFASASISRKEAASFAVGDRRNVLLHFKKQTRGTNLTGFGEDEIVLHQREKFRVVKRFYTERPEEGAVDYLLNLVLEEM